RRHTRFSRDWSSDVCSSDLTLVERSLPPVFLGGVGGGGSSPKRSPPNSLVMSVLALRKRGTVPHGSGRRNQRFAAGAHCGRWSRSEERRVGEECRWREWRSR